MIASRLLPSASASVSTVGTDLIRAAGSRLEEARPHLDLLDAYYGGRQPGALNFVAPEVRAALGTRLNPVVVNWPRMAVGAVEERLDVVGFRLGGDRPVDARLWDVWQANGMDESSQLAHLEALLYGRSFVTVWAGPRIAVESARQVTVLYAPGTRQRTAAVKVWTEDDYGRAVVYEPSKVTRWRTRAKVPEYGGTPPGDAWVLVETIPNLLGVVPVVELRNRPRLLGEGESELSDVIPLTDAISKLASDMMVSAEYHAMPRRWAAGIELVEDADGNVVENFSPVAGRTWVSEAPESKFGQFPEADLSGFVNGVELLTQQLASVTAIPAHYLNSLTGQLPSAESLRAAEAGLVARVRRRQRVFGGAWEEVARLALLVLDGRLPPEAESMETVWADPETRTVAQAADAAVKKADLGVPWAQLMEDLGYSPAQIERMRLMRRQDALDGQGLDLDQLLRGDAS